jgi:hypothetical protein
VMRVGRFQFLHAPILTLPGRIETEKCVECAKLFCSRFLPSQFWLLNRAGVFVRKGLLISLYEKNNPAFSRVDRRGFR